MEVGTATGSSSTYVVPQMPKLIPQTLEDLCETLLSELDKVSSVEFFSKRVVPVLKKLQAETKLLTKLDWSLRLEELVQALKECLNCTYSFWRELVKEVGSTVLEGNGDGESRRRGKPPRNIRTITQESYHILCNILNAVSPKDGYSFFEALMTDSKKGVRFMSFFEEKKIRDTIHPMVGITSLLKLLMDSIRKGRGTFNLGESKALAYHHVRHTSFAANASRRLDEFCMFLMDVIGSPMDNLPLDDVCDALVTTVRVVSSTSLDQRVIERLLSLIYTSLRKACPEIPVEFLLALTSCVLADDWDIEGLIPDLSRVQFLQFIVTLCKGHIENYMGLIDISVLPLENIEQENRKSQEAIGVLVTCAKHHFEDFVPMSLDCFGLISELLVYEKRFDDMWWNLQRGLPYSAMLIKSNPSLINAHTAHVSFMPVMVEALGFIQTLTKSFGKFLEENVVDKGYTEEFVRMWYNLFSDPRPTQSDSIHVLSGVVDCFAALREEVFAQFSHIQRVFCIVSVLEFSQHGRDAVRSSGARCLALYLEFKSLVQDDVHFLLDCLDTIDLQCVSKLSDLSSRQTFSWATSNLCDALAKYHSSSEDPSLGWGTYFKIYHLVIRLAQDNTKLRHNANRAMGALIIWTPVKFLEEPMLGPCVKTMTSLLSKQVATGRDFKARWNAAHALGNVIQKAEIWAKFGSDVADLVFPAFIRILKTSENYKERYQAARGILSVRKRVEFTTYFREIWLVMIDSLKQSPPESKVPIPHGVYEKYTEEVARAIVHLASMTDPGRDLAPSGELESIFLQNYEKLVTARTILMEALEEDVEEEWFSVGRRNITAILDLV